MQTLLTSEKAISKLNRPLKPVQISADDLKSPKIKLMNQHILVLLSELYQFYSLKKKMIQIMYLMSLSSKHTCQVLPRCLVE